MASASFSRRQESNKIVFTVRPAALPKWEVVTILLFTGGFGLIFLWLLNRKRRIVYLTLNQTCLEVEGVSYPYDDIASLWLKSGRNLEPACSSGIVAGGSGIGGAVVATTAVMANQAVAVTQGTAFAVANAVNAMSIKLMLRRKSHSESVVLFHGLDERTGADLINDLVRDAGALAAG